ncbi:unnamed protein product [Prorocentrum cordatum]|uniref:Uncharacterized protein n=1 Tax=Prorocentrum cordatum TaxID=2364126 RepID=A0ABN9QR74_9DINO|nr:unnamed protein product [Polarella glacialis]
MSLPARSPGPLGGGRAAIPAPRSAMARSGGGEGSPAPDSAATEAAWRRAAAAEKSAYGRFCEKLRHPSAKPVVHRMHQFVTEFAAGRPTSEAAEEIHRFQDRAAAWMLSKAVVFAADADEEGTREAEEGLEKFLLCRLYPKLFAATPQIERQTPS